MFGLAWCYLRGSCFEEAAARFCGGLRRYATAVGKPDLYHETVTWAYLALIHERLRKVADASETFDAFIARHPELLAPRLGVLAEHYDRELLEFGPAVGISCFPGDRLLKSPQNLEGPQAWP